MARAWRWWWFLWRKEVGRLDGVVFGRGVRRV
jgi:hypothetical protein